MKVDIALLKADIRDELMKLNKISQEFQVFTSRLALGAEEVSDYDKMVIGYLLHSFYNGCENIFRAVAGFFENHIPGGEWHKDLLRRMKLEVEGYRPRLISEDLFLLLDDFRGFRHRFRHSYSFELDWEREKVVARKLEKTWKLFHEEVEAFLVNFESLQEE
jgi:hypothetical protein